MNKISIVEETLLWINSIDPSFHAPRSSKIKRPFDFSIDNDEEYFLKVFFLRRWKFRLKKKSLNSSGYEISDGFRARTICAHLIRLLGRWRVFVRRVKSRLQNFDHFNMCLMNFKIRMILKFWSLRAKFRKQKKEDFFQRWRVNYKAKKTLVKVSLFH